MHPLLLAAASPVATAAAAAAGKAPAAAATALPGATPVDFSYLHKSPLALAAPWLTHTFAALAIICAILLIALLAVQTTKQEGLSGTIGGRVESAYRGRLGFEGQLARLTSIVAIAFVVCATIVSLSGI